MVIQKMLKIRLIHMTFLNRLATGLLSMARY